MILVSNLTQEFEELCTEYSAHDVQGRDIIFLVKEFADHCEHREMEMSFDYRDAWRGFLEEHGHQVTVQMIGMTIYVLMTYWDKGRELYEALPPLEKILLRDTVQEISDEIERRSAHAE